MPDRATLEHTHKLRDRLRDAVRKGRDKLGQASKAAAANEADLLLQIWSGERGADEATLKSLRKSWSKAFKHLLPAATEHAHADADGDGEATTTATAPNPAPVAATPAHNGMSAEAVVNALLDFEIALGLPSPSDVAPLRMKRQVELLQNKLRDARALERPALQERFTALLAHPWPGESHRTRIKAILNVLG